MSAIPQQMPMRVTGVVLLLFGIIQVILLLNFNFLVHALPFLDLFNR
jgi:succinate dehydrogenase hydrophobic anchor subunit